MIIRLGDDPVLSYTSCSVTVEWWILLPRQRRPSGGRRGPSPSSLRSLPHIVPLLPPLAWAAEHGSGGCRRRRSFFTRGWRGRHFFGGGADWEAAARHGWVTVERRRLLEAARWQAEQKAARAAALAGLGPWPRSGPSGPHLFSRSAYFSICFCFVFFGHVCVLLPQTMWCCVFVSLVVWWSLLYL